MVLVACAVNAPLVRVIVSGFSAEASENPPTNSAPEAAGVSAGVVTEVLPALVPVLLELGAPMATPV